MRYEQLSLFDNDSSCVDERISHKKKLTSNKNEMQEDVSERTIDAFEIMTLPFLGCDYDSVYPKLSYIIPKEKISFSNFGLNEEIMCEIVCAAICHQMNWDYLRSAVYTKSMDNIYWLKPDYLENISDQEIEAMFIDYSKPERIRKEERAELIREVGRWAGKYRMIKDVFLTDRNKLYDCLTVRNNLLECKAFSSDPEEKKLQLLLQKLSSIDLLSGTINYYQPAIDYHLIRLYIRRGLLIPKNKYATEYLNNPSMIRKETTIGAVRQLCSKVLLSICDYTEMDVNTVNLIEWHVGRSICVQNKPDCELINEDAQWVKKKFDKCPFYNTCAARQYNDKLMQLNEPTYRGSSF